MVDTELRLDCIRMKDEIQARILEEEEGLSFEEVNVRREAAILADPILGPWFEKLRAHKADAPASPKP